MTYPHPWSYQIELTEGCNRRCAMCALAALPPGQRYMEPYLALALASEIAGYSPLARIEFAMHGEPLLNPRYPAILATFRAALPLTQLMLTTNGTKMLHDATTWLRTLYPLVNVLVVDLYEPYRLALRRELIEAASALGIWDVVDFYAPDNAYSPWHNHGPTPHTLVLLDDLMLRNGERRQRVIRNQGGNSPLVPPLAKPLPATCVTPFREMAIRYNGEVGICCNDWGLEYKVGDAGAKGVEAVWTSESFMAARRVLAGRARWFQPCRYCDSPAGARAGLLPDVGPASKRDAEWICDTGLRSPRYNGREYSPCP